MGYPKVFKWNHKLVEGLFDDEVLVEEKIDGSQMSFWIEDGELKCKSKEAMIDINYPPKLFAPAVEYVKQIKDYLNPNYTYIGEAVSSRKHNVLTYERTPLHFFIGFDIDRGTQNYLNYEEKEMEFSRLGFEIVPKLYYGRVHSIEELEPLLKGHSILGGNLEGIVIKNYHKFGPDGKVLMGKLVREEFKEEHNKINSKSARPKIETVALKYKTEARYNKALIHLAEKGILTYTPADISKLFEEVEEDLRRECYEEIKEDLIGIFWNDILKIALSGIPSWYKNRLQEMESKKEEE